VASLKAFDMYLKWEGISRELTQPYTPHQNGVAEPKKIGPFFEKARSMVLSSESPAFLWTKVVNTATSPTNMSLTSSNKWYVF
jgi:hypothetical protein